MRNNINKLVLLGQLVQDPEVINNNGSEFLSFVIATNEYYRDVNSESGYSNNTEYHDCIIFNEKAFSKFNFLKGESVYLEGKLSYYFKEGIKKTVIKTRSFHGVTKEFNPKTPSKDDEWQNIEEQVLHNI